MRRLIAVALGLFVALSVTSPASATTDIDAIVGALQKAPVYIEKGTEGTTSDTAATLKDQLRDNDNVVLVMLPADSTLSQNGVDTLASQISDGLKGKRIVGIAVGNQFAGAASILPSGTASDLMNRAATVSTTPAETLGTFIRDVHDWQSDHPESIAKPKASTPVFWQWIVGGGGLLVVIVLFFVFLRRGRIRSRVHYSAPGGLNDPVETMMKLHDKIRSSDPMYDAVETLCKYTEAYFRKFPSEKKSPDTVTLFSNQLELARKVVTQYVDVYKEPQYVDNPTAVLKRGVDAIEGLADSVLASIKKGNADRLMDYNVSTNILDAQRYKDPKSHR